MAQIYAWVEDNDYWDEVVFDTFPIDDQHLHKYYFLLSVSGLAHADYRLRFEHPKQAAPACP